MLRLRSWVILVWWLKELLIYSTTHLPPNHWLSRGPKIPHEGSPMARQQPGAAGRWLWNAVRCFSPSSLSWQNIPGGWQGWEGPSVFPYLPPLGTEGLNRGWKWALQTKGTGERRAARGTNVTLNLWNVQARLAKGLPVIKAFFRGSSRPQLSASNSSRKEVTFFALKNTHTYSKMLRVAISAFLGLWLIFMFWILLYCPSFWKQIIYNWTLSKLRKSLWRHSKWRLNWKQF